MRDYLFTPIRLNELEVLIEHSVQRALKHISSTNLQPEIEKPKNIDEAVNITGFSKPTIYLYCQKNTIPHHKKNGRLFFFESELIDWIKEGKQKTAQEIESDVDSLLSRKNKAMQL